MDEFINMTRDKDNKYIWSGYCEYYLDKVKKEYEGGYVGEFTTTMGQGNDKIFNDVFLYDVNIRNEEQHKLLSGKLKWNEAKKLINSELNNIFPYTHLTIEEVSAKAKLYKKMWENFRSRYAKHKDETLAEADRIEKERKAAKPKDIEFI